ncbi:MAG: TonB-dependent receptor [Proteobacteria bacterium]|nr:TonB-dependent receptor [Pseudomonadota bacterium]
MLKSRHRAQLRARSLMLLTTVSAAAMMVSHSAVAAEQQLAAADQLADASRLEEIVITGRPLADSQAQALLIQRESSSLVSVLSADAVGNLPDQNVAFAVGRLPGVAIERDQGQARYVNLRGAPVYWTTLSFDGLSVVSPQGRDSRFDNIPSAIASQITVEKAILPSMPGGTVAGNVDIRTRRAFDYDGQKITGKLAAGYVKLGGGMEYDSSLVYSNTFSDNFGIVAQGSFYSREMATDNWETDPYLSNTFEPGERYAREHENKHYRLTRQNISGSTRMDYRWDENNGVFASTIYTLYHDDELRDNFIVRLDQGTDAAGNSYTSQAFITPNNPKQGTVYGARINARIDYRDTKEKMSTSTLGGEHMFGEWAASWRYNYTWTFDGRDTPVTAAFQSPSAFNLRPTIDYDLRDTGKNFITFFQTGGATAARSKGAQVANIEDFQFPATSVGDLWGGDVTLAHTAKLDLDRTVDFGGHETKIEFGGLYTTRIKKSRETGHAQTTFAAAPTWSTFVNGNTIGYLGTQDLKYTFRYTDKDFTTNYVKNLVSAGTAVKTDTSANFYKVGEDILAGYLMGTTMFDWGNVVYGVRVEHIKNDGRAYVAFPASGATPAETRLVDVGASDTLFYPSLHVNWDIERDLKARVSFTTSASRPDFDDLRPNFTISDSNQSISGGNPTAKPEKQMGVDAYLEWYISQTSYFSAGVFYKDIKDALVQTSRVFGLDTLDTPTLDRSGYAYTAVGNAGDGNLKGVEFAFTGNIEDLVEGYNGPEWLGGFGTNLSITATDSKINLAALPGVAARSIPLLGSSDLIYNVQLTYEKYDLSVRLAYQWRSPWGQSIGAYRTIGGALYPVDNGDIYWDSDEELDLSVRYQVTSNIEAYFDAVNLTNQGARRYGDSDLYPIEYEKFGPRFIGGVRFNF